MKTLFSDYRRMAGVATDLVNTSARVRSGGDVLTDTTALAAFLADHGVRDGPKPKVADVDRVHALRDEVREILELADEDVLVTAAAELASRATVGPTLVRDDDGAWQWGLVTAPRASVADELAVVVGTGMLAVVRTLDHGRFRHCESPTCDGMFVDTSRAGRRRYCMPELCGNRTNVANYRARQHR